MFQKFFLISSVLLCFPAMVFSTDHATDHNNDDHGTEEKKRIEIENNTEKTPSRDLNKNQQLNDRTDEAAQALVNRLSVISSLKGKFKQSIMDESGVSLQDTEGDFKLKRPGYLDWRTAPPFEQRVLSNGEKLWVYDPDLEQVTIYDQKKMQTGPANILNGSLEQIRANYFVKYDSVDSSKISKENKSKANESISRQALKRFVLTPKDQQDGSFTEVALVFTDEAIKSVSMLDKLGQKTIIYFSETTLNASMGESEFLFTPPAGTDIVVDGV